MTSQKILHLPNRALLRLSGTEAAVLLQRLITTNLDDLLPGEAHYGALLSPQGKILFDFLISVVDDGFLFDLDVSVLDEFEKKMKLYRMRSDVTITRSDDRVGVAMQAPENEKSRAVRDARSPLLGWRVFGDGAGFASNEALAHAYLEHHIDAVIPQAGLDFALGSAFPHDVNMDQLGAVDFEKGCYVGQEVVSRMQHRSTARRRLVRVQSQGDLPPTGTPILADGKSVGTIGARLGNKGLAILRLDRVADANEQSIPLLAKNEQLEVQLPDYATFTLAS